MTIEKEDRSIIGVDWSLLATWYCVPMDMTFEERDAFLRMLRDEVFPDGLHPVGVLCPLEYIAQRCYGGFCCAEPNRAHVVHATGEYSMMGAAEGEYYPRSTASRRETWLKILAANDSQSWGGGPFTEDAPSLPEVEIYKAQVENQEEA